MIITIPIPRPEYSMHPQGFLDIINSNVYTMIESKEWVILIDVWLMKEVH